MKRIDDRTVELTPAEMDARDYFEQLLDVGKSIPEAVAIVKDVYRGTGDCGQPGCTECNLPSVLSGDFLDYLGA